jgi:hypothetical protein
MVERMVLLSFMGSSQVAAPKSQERSKFRRVPRLGRRNGGKRGFWFFCNLENLEGEQFA